MLWKNDRRMTMRLDEYMKDRGISMAQMVEFLNCSASYIRKIAPGRCIPSHRIAIQVKNFTNGEVILGESRVSKKKKLKEAIDEEIKTYKDELKRQKREQLRNKIRDLKSKI